MEIKSDINLAGGNWRKAINGLSKFFSQSLQPNYSIFAISLSIGIMYDKQLDIAGEETEEEKDNRPSVPRTVLYQHNTDLDFLFQAAILTTTTVTYDRRQRMVLAFDNKCDIDFNRMEFLLKFANFGVGKLLESVSDEPIETMENIKVLLASTMEGYNYEIDSIPDEALDIEDL